jgi:drug/metabolite transporter (DMT)-like permease
MENSPQLKNKGLIFAFIALFSWGIHGPAGRYLAINGVNMFFVTEIRFVIGAFVLFLYLLFKGKFKLNIKENFKEIFILTFIGVVVNSTLYHLTLKYLPATLVMILENLSPVFVFLLSYLFQKVVPRKSEFIALIISLLGIGLIVFGKGSFPKLQEHFYLGILLGILTGATFGFYIFYSALMVKEMNKDDIILLLFKILAISAIIGSPILFKNISHPRTNLQWFWLIEMGVFQSGLSPLFWNYALSLLPINSVSILFLFTILFTTINEIIFLGLHLNIYLIFGGILILLSGIIIQKSIKIKPGEIIEC